jgi:hypothetical protein
MTNSRSSMPRCFEQQLLDVALQVALFRRRAVLDLEMAGACGQQGDEGVEAGQVLEHGADHLAAVQIERAVAVGRHHPDAAGPAGHPCHLDEVGEGKLREVSS